jgi:hypothetical protein
MFLLPENQISFVMNRPNYKAKASSAFVTTDSHCKPNHGR